MEHALYLVGSRGEERVIMHVEVGEMGDEVIVCSADYVKPGDLYNMKPTILTYLPDNRIDQILQYEVYQSQAREYDFRIVDAVSKEIESSHTYPNVDITKIREELSKKGMQEDDIQDFIERHLML